MQIVRPDFWSAEYNEAEDAIRVLVNGWSRNAVLFRITKDNVVALMEALENPDTAKLSLVGQEMVSQEDVLLYESEECDTDDVYELNYETRTDDLTPFYKPNTGPKNYTVIFDQKVEQDLFAVELWQHWALDHLLAQAN